MNVKKLLSTRRFIPAYAGNSFGQRSLAITLYGSSPLTRGTHPSLNVNKSPARFIPAYAGNSISIRRKRKDSTVHPRLRGELCFWRSAIARATGSSPLTRGTLFRSGVEYVERRFIPAYAGNSLKQGIEHLTNSSKDFLSGKYAKNPETVLNHFKNSSLD